MSDGSVNPVAEVLLYWNMIRRHRWWIFLTTLALTLVSVVGIALLPDYYRATTTILVDPKKVPDHFVKSTVGASLTERLQIITQEALSATR